MREERKVQVYTCDVPSCPVKVMMETDELPDGFHGSVSHISGLGGNGAEWFACTERHIRGAVMASLNRQYEQQ